MLLKLSVRSAGSEWVPHCLERRGRTCGYLKQFRQPALWSRQMTWWRRICV